MNLPMPYRSQQAWLADWKHEIARMHYLKITNAEASESLRQMVKIAGKLKKPNLNLEFIKPDVENLWNALSEDSTDAAHTFVDTPTGFECSFYIVIEDSYLTGSVSVSRYS
jgi:hypothetical protein